MISSCGVYAQVIGRPPVITSQPQSSQIVAAGSTVTFSVSVAPSQTPLSYRWLKGGAGIAGATNATLVVTNVQRTDAGNYSVVVANAAGSVTSSESQLGVIVLASHSVSTGAEVVLRAQVFHYNSVLLASSWRFNDQIISGATNLILSFANVQLANAGRYSLMVTNRDASIGTTVFAQLEVDPAFTKITSGALVEDSEYTGGAAWMDYDNDGDLDMAVGSGGGQGSGSKILYRNDTGGTFTKLHGAIDPPEQGQAYSVAWGDYDNDGWVDVFFATWLSATSPNGMYRNQGNRVLRKVTGKIVTEIQHSTDGVWGDYDNDGLIDLFVTNNGRSYLVRNDGQGGFTRITTAPLGSLSAVSDKAAWADYDNDGFLDLFVYNSGQAHALFRNNRDGTFLRVSDSPIVQGRGTVTGGAAWGDYNNDGFLDLFVANGDYSPSKRTNLLYRNNGDGTFTQITEGPIATDLGSSTTGSWGDFDNDGFLDLFVSHHSGTATLGENNALYRNNGDGTFAKVTSGSLVNDAGNSNGVAWGDYDNDGFLDLYVADYGRRNLLYRNNGNGHQWLKFKLVGQVSNRSALGAKVRVRAGIGGKQVWQLREVSNGDGISGNSLDPHFGLGNAAVADLVRIEWPSGIVQEMHDVAAKQFLTVTEPVLLVEPKAVEFVGGSDVQFRVGTNATQMTNYQWRFNGADLLDETNAVLNVKSVGASSAGKYSVVIKLPNGDTVESTAGIIKPPVPPTILEQPQSQTVDAGASVSFRVVASGSQPFTYQWYLNNEPIPNAANAVLVISDAQPDRGGDYDVLVSNAGGSVRSSVATLRFVGAPVFTLQPKDQSLSLGANATFRAFASGTLPLHFQWQVNGVDIPGATNSSLILTNVQLANAGRYSARVMNSLGRAASSEAILSVDPTFTKITTGLIVTERQFAAGTTWGDYDNDGFLDLFVGQFSGRNILYRNDGRGSFIKITADPAVEPRVDTRGTIWGDYDNDGFLDLFVSNSQDRNFLFHNLGNGKFERISTAPLGTDAGDSRGAAWGDYDNDGFIDLFLPQGENQRRFLYHNSGNGTFERVNADALTADRGYTIGSSWGDYDNDGRIDLFVATYPVAGRVGSPNFLYRNLGNGSFTRINTGSVVTDRGASAGGAWGDYDNDGFLDLFVPNDGEFGEPLNYLYQNLRDGTFRRVTDAGPIVTDRAQAWDCAWADYDNDGYLDLFVANPVGPANDLYRNKGDGTFEKVTTGSLANDRNGDGSGSSSCTWGDYDNDGFLDLFAGNGALSGLPQFNYLYRNNGNANGWLKVKCIGTRSNRAAIGAKVRLRATIAGKTVWQMREISGGGGYRSQNGLLPHFGLGDATRIDIVRIEWPSGIVQEFRDVQLKQSLTVIEPEIWIAQVLPSGSIERVQSIQASAGGDVILQAPVLATHPRLQWTRDGAAMAGATNEMLKLPRVDLSDRGQYTVVLSGSSGTVWATPVRLAVRSTQFVSDAVIVSTLAGASHPPVPQNPGPDAQFHLPNGGFVDSQGNVYVADTPNHRIVKISPAGMVTWLAGSGNAGSEDGPAASAQFNSPLGVAVDSNGTVYVAESGNHRIRKIGPDGVVASLAGSGFPGYRDGPVFARFNVPNDLVLDGEGNLFVSEFLNHTVRKIERDGRVSTVAGQGTNPGYADGPALEALFHRPGGIAIDRHGNLFLSETAGHRIRKISRDGIVSTVAGTGLAGYVDGPSLAAEFNSPEGIVVDQAGTIYVTELGNDVIRRITPDGRVETVAGTGTYGNTDGPGRVAQFFDPGGIGIDAQGNLYVADTANRRVRKITISQSPGFGIRLDAFVDPFKRSVELVVTAPSGQTISIEASLNLGDWTPLATLTTGTNPVRYADPISVTAPFKFYRARKL